jgi:hypothetical protein
MKKNLLACIATLSLAGCGSADAVKLEEADVQVNVSPAPRARLSEINLAATGRIASKGRVQDREYQRLPVVEELIAHGKESIPYLISRLEDETKVEGQVFDYWSEVRVGDVALVVLTNFFTDKSGTRTTVPGIGWDEFLGGGNDARLTGEERLRNYIELRGRKSIKERWQQVWEQQREHIFWDEEERCFVSKNTN